MGYSMLIDQASSVPKYKQIINTIVSDIQCRRLDFHERLPSINAFSTSNDISRDTVEKAYRQLKKDGLIISVPGKGYFAAAPQTFTKKKVLLLFNKLSSYKKVIFESFISTIRHNAIVDFYVYNEQLCTFRQILKDKSGQYTDYVIIPSFKGQEEFEARETVRSVLKEERVWILNTRMHGLENLWGGVYQNYEKDIFNALHQAHHKLARYNKLILVFPTHSNYSRGIVKGFTRYCCNHHVSSDIVYKFDARYQIVPGAAYIVILDKDLSMLVKRIRYSGLFPGEDIGILSYNDSPLKEVLLDGVTVMTTDHEAMGRKIAHAVMTGKKCWTENDFCLIERKTL